MAGQPTPLSFSMCNVSIPEVGKGRLKWARGDVPGPAAKQFLSVLF